MKTLRFLLLFTFAPHLSASTIPVTSTDDTIVVDGACTLREAVTAANTNAVSGDCSAGDPGLDQIHFSIGGGGTQFISPATAFPDIVDPVTIDGTTQPGFSGTPLVIVSLNSFANAPMFVVATSGGGSTFRGLILNNPSEVTLRLQSSGNLVAGNYFGSNPDGTIAVQNVTGVFIRATVGSPASNNVIGGASATDRNVFMGTGGLAVTINADAGAVADANQILGNYVGWNATKTVPTGGLFEGLSLIGATNTTILGNSIVSSGSGIALGSSGTIVQSNEITGNAFSGIVVLGNDNIIGASTSGGTGGNLIIGNGTLAPNNAGVLVRSGVGNRISGNSMAGNGSPSPGIGIDLFPFGATPNDACDADTDANLLQNKPVLTSAVASNGTIIVDGSLNSVALASYTIELYANHENLGAQGQQYIGSVGVTTDGACNALFTATITFVPPGDEWTITATAIDPANNTSEMSDPAEIVVLDAPTVSKQFFPVSVAVDTASVLTITLANSNALPITDVAFTDNYPASLENAPVPSVTNNCGGTITAAGGGSTLTLSGGTIPANGNCTVTVAVVPRNEGSFVNTLPAGSVTSMNAPPSDAAATATLTAGAATAEVPMSPAALMLMVLALAITAILVLRQMR